MTTKNALCTRIAGRNPLVRSEAGGKLVPAQLEVGHELLVFRVPVQLTHTGVIAEERIVGHATIRDTLQPGDRFMWFAHLGACCGQDESGVMNMVAVLPKAGRNLDFAYGLQRLTLSCVEIRAYCGNIRRIVSASALSLC